MLKSVCGTASAAPGRTVSTGTTRTRRTLLILPRNADEGPPPGMSEGQFELAAQELGAIANRLRTHRINQQIQPATE